MQELSSLQQKVSRLVKNYEALKAAREKSDQVLAEKELIIELQNQRISELEDQLQKITIAQQIAETDPDNKETLKQFLDELIGKIDHHIKLLNS